MVSWAAFGLFLLLLAWMAVPRRGTPEEQERRRRQSVNQGGRITDAVVTDVRLMESAAGVVAHLALFTYTIHGVDYAASQDITALLAYLDADPRALAGPASAKYLPANPSNSILVCESWSGLRQRATSRTGQTPVNPPSAPR